MFAKNFFLGVLTTLLVVVVLGLGGLVAMRAFIPAFNLGGVPGSQSAGPEQPAGGEFQGDNFGGRGEFDRAYPHFRDGGGSEFGRGNGGHGHANFAPLRGLGRVLGSLVLIGVIIGAVIGGQKLFSRFQRRPGLAPVAGSAVPATPAAEPDEPVDPAAAPLAEIEPADSPDEVPAESEGDVLEFPGEDRDAATPGATGGINRPAPREG